MSDGAGANRHVTLTPEIIGELLEEEWFEYDHDNGATTTLRYEKDGGTNDDTTRSTFILTPEIIAEVLNKGHYETRHDDGSTTSIWYETIPRTRSDGWNE